MNAQRSTRQLPRLCAALAVLAGLTAAVSGCAVSTSKASTDSGAAAASGTASGTPGGAVGTAELPDAVRERGYLTVAIDPTYPPFETLSADQKTIQGLDPDLIAALAEELGVEVRFKRTGFESIIAGLQAGRYDLALSAMTDTAEREKQVSFVDYFDVGGAVVMAKDDPLVDQSLPGALCGKKVAIQIGTIVDDLSKKASKECVAKGSSAIQLQNYPSVPAAVLAVSAGRASYVWTDSVSAATQVKNGKGRFVARTDHTPPQPTGMALPKSSTGLRDALADALDKVIASGKYRAILARYGLLSGAVDEVRIDGAGS